MLLASQNIQFDCIHHLYIRYVDQFVEQCPVFDESVQNASGFFLPKSESRYFQPSEPFFLPFIH